MHPAEIANRSAGGLGKWVLASCVMSQRRPDPQSAQGDRLDHGAGRHGVFETLGRTMFT